MPRHVPPHHMVPPTLFHFLSPRPLTRSPVRYLTHLDLEIYIRCGYDEMSPFKIENSMCLGGRGVLVLSWELRW